MRLGSRLSGRSTWSLASVLLFILAMTACSSGGGSATNNGTLVVDSAFSLKTADPARDFEPPTGYLIVKALYSTLLTFNGSDVSKVVPAVASSYDVSQDGTTYTFHLRHDIKFSDGTPLTS